MNISFLGYVGVFFIVIAVLLLSYFASKTNTRMPDVSIKSEEKSSPWMLMIIFSFVILMIFGMTLSDGIPKYRHLLDIERHGRRSEANVDSFRRQCGRSGNCSLYVQYHYSFTSAGDGRAMQSSGEAYIGADTPDNQVFFHAQNTGLVPIAYDLDNPQNSALNLNDSALSGYQAQQVISRIKTFGATWLIVLGGMALFLGLASLSRRRGWTT